jgi:hypothetical protein
MALLTVTAAQVAVVRGDEDKTVWAMNAFAALLAGDAVYRRSDGSVDKCDTSTAGKQQFRGIALDAVAAGSATRVVFDGFLMGYDLSGIAYDGLVYASDTPGRLADAAGTKSVVVGRVWAINKVGGPVKVLRVFVTDFQQW